MDWFASLAKVMPWVFAIGAPTRKQSIENGLGVRTKRTPIYWLPVCLN